MPNISNVHLKDKEVRMLLSNRIPFRERFIDKGSLNPIYTGTDRIAEYFITFINDYYWKQKKDSNVKVGQNHIMKEGYDKARFVQEKITINDQEKDDPLYEGNRYKNALYIAFEFNKMKMSTNMAIFLSESTGVNLQRHGIEATRKDVTNIQEKILDRIGELEDKIK